MHMTTKTVWPLFACLFLFFQSLQVAGSRQAQMNDTITVVDKDTVFTFLLAASQGDSALVLKLLKNGVPPDTTGWDGITALMFAVNNGHLGVVKTLADNGAKLSRRDQYGNTPLMAAVQNGNLRIAETLIRNGAGPDISDAYGITPLMLAVGMDSFALADMLVYYGADVVKADSAGTTPLMVASVTGNADIASVLLDAGADPNARDKKGYAPLHAAAWYGYWTLAGLLLDYGADPDKAADNGYTPLGVAVEADDLVAVKLLASSGADLNHPITRSQNPLSIALEKRNDSIASFLRRNQARFNKRPSFNRFGFGTELNWNADDLRWSFFLAASEKKYNLNLSAGWGFRPSAIRVLVTENESVRTQYRERRGNLFLSLEKSVYFIHGSNGFQGGLYGGLKGIYTFGSYRGTGIKPDDRIIAAPGAGLSLDGRFLRITAGYEYLNLDLYRISPHRVNISVSFLWSSKKNNFKPQFISWF